MNQNHRLSGADLDSLAAGPGDAAIVRRLRAAQVSKRMLQLRLLLDQAPAGEFTEHYALLSEAVRRSPRAGTAVLELPHTGAWLAAALRRLRGTAGPAPRHSDASGDLLGMDLAHLGALAAVAAIHADIEFKIELPARDGGIFLPALGQVRVSSARAVVSRLGGEVRVGESVVPVGEESTRPAPPDWSGLRRLRAVTDGLAIEIVLDDLDPYRDCHRLSAADRLCPDEVAGWQRLLDRAWRILVRNHREYAVAIAEGLRTVVPLRAAEAGSGVNVTSMDAFGAVSMTPPADEYAFALGLLHEFQHAKLGATIDVIPLHRRTEDGKAEARYYAPWRDDPRPLGALLHGVYAFTAVTDFWRVQRHLLTGGPARMAEIEFARWRDRVHRSRVAVEESAALTPAGRRFVAGIRALHERWRTEPVPVDAVELAREAAEDHWVGWRLRNQRPAPEAVTRLAAAWRSGEPCPVTAVPVTTGTATGRWLTRSPRLDLVRLRITDPDRFHRFATGAEPLAEARPDASAADLALAAGDHLTAREGYRHQIMTDPEPLGPWIGFTLACQRAAAQEEPALMHYPELCRAVHRELVGSGAPPPDPLALAWWLIPVRCPDRVS